jgi:hypothetical protein
MLNREYAVIAVLMILVCILATANVASSDDDAMTRPAPAARSFARAPRGNAAGGGAAPPAGGGAGGGGGAHPAPAANAPVIVNIPNQRQPHPGDPGAEHILLGAAQNATGHEARVVAVADNHYDNLAQGERRRALAWEDVTLRRVSAWRGLAVAAIVIGSIALLILVWLAGKNYSEPTVANATTASYAIPASSGPTSVVIASPAPAYTGKTVTCGTATSPCPAAVDICQRQGSESGIQTCCDQISDKVQRELCVAVINGRLALR